MVPQMSEVVEKRLSVQEKSLFESGKGRRRMCKFHDDLLDLLDGCSEFGGVRHVEFVVLSDLHSKDLLVVVEDLVYHAMVSFPQSVQPLQIYV